MTSLAQFLKNVRIFENLTEEELDLLCPLFEIQNIRPKQRIVKEGDQSDFFYVIRSGQCTVTKGIKDTFITILGPKDYFGEASLFHNVRRSANVTTDTDTQLLVLQKPEFQQFLFSYPMAANRILFRMLKEVFFRLEETSSELEQSRGAGGIAENAIHTLLR